MKNLDRKKQKHFRGAHPARYQADVVSIPSTVRSKTTNTGRELIRELIERKSQVASRQLSQRSQVSASGSQRLQALSTRSSAQRPTEKPGLKEFINQQSIYEDVVDQISQKIAM